MKKALSIKIVLVVLILLFIWGNSLMPGTVSQAESTAVERLVAGLIVSLQRLFARFGADLTAEFLVRKLAHFTEFALLGIFMTILLLRADGRTRPLPAALLCLCAAAADETIQLLWVDRSSRVTDVCIDFSGALCGIAAASLVCLIIRLTAKRKGGRAASSRKN